MEKTKCLKCGRVGYTASPEEAPCPRCGRSYKDIHLSYRVSIASASTYATSDGAFKMKINIKVTILLDNKVLFFVSNLTFCSLNEAENFDYTSFLRKKREDLFKYRSPIQTKEAAYLYIIDRRPHGGAS